MHKEVYYYIDRVSVARSISMTTRLEVESAIKQLPEGEVRNLAKWLQDYLDEMWDRQIEEDLEFGKLDDLIAQAEADIARGNVRHLDEVLRDS
jgi:ribosomal protein S13